MLWYIASPYGDEDADLMQRRFDRVCATAARLMRDEGLHVLSPIAHSHPIAQYGLPTGWEYWRETDVDLMGRCDGLIVVTIDGWDDSRGVRAEIDWAAEHGWPILYVEPAE